ncbi:hypothetical protein FRC02_007400 [Tulasnella sp. 418]|nr:hypothetical protein FRC02_007400 [Tulasnella sp. 418]
MHLSTLIPFVALVITGASASMPVTPFHEIVKRQTVNTPQQCINQCNVATNELTACGSDLKCMCSNSLVGEMADCFNCAIPYDASQKSFYQSTLDQFTQACTAAGFPVQSVTLTGGGSNNGGGNNGGGANTNSVVVAPTTINSFPSATKNPTVAGTTAASNNGGGNTGLGGTMNTGNGASNMKASVAGVLIAGGALVAGLL